MRKFRSILLCIVLAATGLVFQASVAGAHGSNCFASAPTPNFARSGSTPSYDMVSAQGSYTCEVTHPQRTVTIQVFRRFYTSTGSFGSVYRRFDKVCGTVGQGCFDIRTFSVTNPGCYDWRTVVTGQAYGAQVGWHNFKTATSGTLQGGGLKADGSPCVV